MSGVSTFDVLGLLGFVSFMLLTAWVLIGGPYR
jgi:hypothetical protein